MKAEEGNPWGVLFENGKLLPDDEELGYAVLCVWGSAEGVEYGLGEELLRASDDQLLDYFRNIAFQLNKKEANHAWSAPIEKVLHKISEGDFKGAGRIFREYANEAALAEKFIPIGINKSQQAKTFGLRGLETQIKKANKKASIIKKSRDAILVKRKKNPTQRELARLVSDDTGYPFATVRGHLNKLK